MVLLSDNRLEGLEFKTPLFTTIYVVWGFLKQGSNSYRLRCHKALWFWKTHELGLKEKTRSLDSRKVLPPIWQ